VKCLLCAPTVGRRSGSPRPPAWKQRQSIACWKSILERASLLAMSQPVGLRLLVVDETSMVDVLLMHSLLRAIPHRSGLVLWGMWISFPRRAGTVLHD